MTVDITPRVFLDRNGDIEKEKDLINFALNQRNILRNLMGFNNIQQDNRTVNMADGSVITVQSCFGLDNVFISSPVVATYGYSKTKYVDVAVFIGENSDNFGTGYFAWDIANDSYYSMKTNDDAVGYESIIINEKESYRLVNGKKVVVGNGFPFIHFFQSTWLGNTFSYAIDSAVPFRYWFRDSFMGFAGTVTGTRMIKGNQELVLKIDSMTQDPDVTLKLGTITPPSTIYYNYDINTMVDVGDYIINCRNDFGRDRECARIIDYNYETNSILIDRPIFDLEEESGSRNTFTISPMSPLYYAVPTYEGNTTNWKAINYIDNTVNSFMYYASGTDPENITTVSPLGNSNIVLSYGIGGGASTIAVASKVLLGLNYSEASVYNSLCRFNDRAVIQICNNYIPNGSIYAQSEKFIKNKFDTKRSSKLEAAVSNLYAGLKSTETENTRNGIALSIAIIRREETE